VPPKARVAPVHATERYGLVWLCLDDPVAGVPEISQDADPSFRRINFDVDVWRTAATRMVDNFLDITHFPYVHAASFGSAAQTEVPHFELGDLGDWYGYRYSVTAANPGAATAASGQATATVQRHMSSGFALPFAVRSTIEYETGLHHILLLLSTPRDDESSSFTFVVWRNDDFSVPAEDVTRLDKMIEAEDKRMLERVRGTLPLDNTALVSVQSDKASVEWRRQLRALLT
jgi:phenylpropionate dioxygenase-like ring-hydroxylating dioxygenase large terminal subunit